MVTLQNPAFGNLKVFIEELEVVARAPVAPHALHGVAAEFPLEVGFGFHELLFPEKRTRPIAASAQDEVTVHDPSLPIFIST